MTRYQFIASLGFCAFLCAFQKVDINEATSEQIALLPSIGLGLAKEITNYRQKNKGFRSQEELRSVSGMTPKKFESILPFIVVNAPKRSKTSQPMKESLHSIEKRAVIPLPDLEQAAFLSMGMRHGFLQSLRERARSSAWLPRLGLAFDVDRDIDTAEKGLRNKPQPIEKRGLGLGFAVRASFDLPEIVFNKAELEIENLELRHLEKREKIAEKLQNLYFRYVALAESGDTPQEASQIKNIETSLAALALSLDSLSEGAFSKYQREHEVRP